MKTAISLGKVIVTCFTVAPMEAKKNSASKMNSAPNKRFCLYNMVFKILLSVVATGIYQPIFSQNPNIALGNDSVAEWDDRASPLGCPYNECWIIFFIRNMRMGM